MGAESVFDGVNDAVNTNALGNNDLIFRRFSVGSWLKFPSLAVNSGTETLYRRQSGAYMLKFTHASDIILFRWVDTVGTPYDVKVIDDIKPVAGQWHHVFMTVGDQVKIFMDGVLAGVSKPLGSSTPKVGNSDLQISPTPRGEPWAMDEFRIYDRELSSAEVAVLYQAHSGS